jgi:hypothetical protein
MTMVTMYDYTTTLTALQQIAPEAHIAGFLIGAKQ